MTFQLDTSGFVMWAKPGQALSRYMHWPDLSPFAKGYIEALFEEWSESLDEVAQEKMSWPPNSIAFSDLAPETLARIIADCEAMVEAGGLPYHFAGTGFWSGRQAGNWTKAQPAEKYLKAVPAFPPLTVQLSNDGKVRFA